MADELYMRKSLQGALVPADRFTQEKLDRLKSNHRYRVDVRRPRNIRHSAKYHALVHTVFENQEMYDDIDDLKAALKVKTGWAKEVLVTDAEGNEYQVRVPKSIKFAKMDQFQFEQFYDKALTVICRDIIPGMDRDELEAETQNTA